MPHLISPLDAPSYEMEMPQLIIALEVQNYIITSCSCVCKYAEMPYNYNYANSHLIHYTKLFDTINQESPPPPHHFPDVFTH